MYWLIFYPEGSWLEVLATHFPGLILFICYEIQSKNCTSCTVCPRSHRLQQVHHSTDQVSVRLWWTTHHSWSVEGELFTSLPRKKKMRRSHSFQKTVAQIQWSCIILVLCNPEKQVYGLRNCTAIFKLYSCIFRKLYYVFLCMCIHIKYIHLIYIEKYIV